MASAEAEEFCAWARTRNVGCFFARAMFTDPAAYGIAIEYLPETSGAVLAASVAEATRRAITHEKTEAAAFIFNRDLDLTEYAALLKNLVTVPDWYLREERLNYKAQEFVVIGVDAAVGTENGVPALSEIVGFGPYEYLPITRRAPVPAIVLRTKAAFSLDPLPSRSERRANLAAIRLQIDTNAFNALWDKSKALRAELDGQDNPMTRARVALAIPAQTWAAINTSSVVRSSNG